MLVTSVRVGSVIATAAERLARFRSSILYRLVCCDWLTFVFSSFFIEK